MAKNAVSKTFTRATASGPWASKPAIPLYDGLTPNIYAADTAVGAEDGSSEEDAMLLQDALAIAVAGDVIGLLPGIYSDSISSGDHWDPIFAFANSGTEGNPITLVGKYDAIYNFADPARRCEFRNATSVFFPTPAVGDIPGMSGNYPVFGSYQQDYLHFINLYLDQQYVMPYPSKGCIVNSETTGCKFRKIVVAVRSIDPDDSDNFNPFFMQGGEDAIYEHLYGYAAEVHAFHNRNVCFMSVYASHGFLIQNISMLGLNGGIFIKGSGGGDTIGNSGEIRYIKGVECNHSPVIIGTVVAGSETGNQVEAHHVLSIRCGLDSAGLATGGYQSHFSGDPGDGSQARNRILHHFTVVDPGGLVGSGLRAGAYFEGTVFPNDVFRDSVIANTAIRTVDMVIVDALTGVAPTINYNVYHTAGGAGSWRYGASDGEGGSAAATLAAWVAATSYDDDSDFEDPQFDDAENDDFRRTASGDTGSSTGGKRGCFETGLEVIGDGVH